MTAESCRTLTLVDTIAAFAAVDAAARELNLNISPQDETDEPLYSQFEQPTRVAINRAAGKPDELIGRIEAEASAAGVVETFARDPRGGDTDQIRAITAGACRVRPGHHDDVARLIRAKDPADQKMVDAVGWMVPDQDGRGTQITISSAGVPAKAPARDAAVAFLESLASDETERRLADGGNEFAVVDGVERDDPVPKEFGDVRADELEVSVLGESRTGAQVLCDRAGWV